MNTPRRICATIVGATVGLTALVAVPLAAAGPAAARPSPIAPCTPDPGFDNCLRYGASGADQSFTVPPGITSIRAKLWGAGGGGPTPAETSRSSAGGAGGYTTGTMATTPGDVLRVVVGVGGANTGLGDEPVSAYGGGGIGGWALEDAAYGGGGGGGGMSGMFGSPDNSAPLLIAGGGGGGGGVADANANQTDSPSGGAGGGTEGTRAVSGHAQDGLGGGQDVGGSGGTRSYGIVCLQDAEAGGEFTGGDGGSGDPNNSGLSGGGGGGGYRGGGGGACTDNEASSSLRFGGGGGGGSGFIAPSVVGGETTAGDVGGDSYEPAQPANTVETQYEPGAGYGSSDTGGGGNGEIVLEWANAPAVSNVTSSGTGTSLQHPTIAVPDGGSLRLLDSDGTPVTSLTVTGEGTYTVNTATDTIWLEPVSGFHGTATPVRYRLTDANGNYGDAAYTATVLPPSPPSPHASASAPGRVVLTSDATTIPVTCALTAGSVSRCDVTLYFRFYGRPLVVGSGSVVVRGGSSAKVQVPVRLNAFGQLLSAAVGGVRVRAAATVWQRGNAAAMHPQTFVQLVKSPVVAPHTVVFGPSSATLTPGDVSYLNYLRARTDGVRTMTCLGGSDLTGIPVVDYLVARARAATVCGYLTRGTHIRSVLLTTPAWWYGRQVGISLAY